MADLTPKGPYTQSAPEGGRKTITIVIMMMTIMILMCFLISRDLKQGWQQGEPIKDDDDDEIDDNDTDDDDDDDDDDNNDGYGVFFLLKDFFVGI